MRPLHSIASLDLNYSAIFIANFDDLIFS